MAGDHRPSLEERYPTKNEYVTAFRAAVDRLVAARLLLPDDAATLERNADGDGGRSDPGPFRRADGSGSITQIPCIGVSPTNLDNYSHYANGITASNAT